MTRFSNEVLEIFRAILKRVAPDVSSLPPLGRLTKQKNRFGVTLGKKIVMRAKFCHYASIRLLLRPKTKSRIRHFGNSAKMMHWRPNATKRHRKMSRHSSAWKKKKKKNHHCAYLWIYPWELSKLCRRPSYKESLMMRRLLFKKKKSSTKYQTFSYKWYSDILLRKTVHISFI